MADATPPSQIERDAIEAVVERLLASREQSIAAISEQDSNDVNWSDRLHPSNHQFTAVALICTWVGAYATRVFGEANWEHVVAVMTDAATALGYSSVPAMLVGAYGIWTAKPISRAIAARRKAVPRA